MKACLMPGCDRTRISGYGQSLCEPCRERVKEEWRIKNLPPVDRPMPPSEQRAWAAGFFDGEGCFSGVMRSGRSTVRPVATISQVDREVLDRFCGIVACGGVYEMIGRWKNPRQRFFYVWRISARADFDHVVEVLWPWLGTIKREAALKVLQSAGLSQSGHAESRRTRCCAGHEFTDENIRWVKAKNGWARHCNQCYRDRYRAKNPTRKDEVLCR